MEKVGKFYLMTAGTFLPGIAFALIAAKVMKQPITYKNGALLVAFALGSLAGGYFSAQLLKK
jgi:hypothetical protein